MFTVNYNTKFIKSFLLIVETLLFFQVLAKYCIMYANYHNNLCG